MKYTVGLFVILASARLGQAIRCYECSSINNTMCIDPESYDQETRQKFLKSTDCQQGVLTPDSHVFFCRKIVQTIFHKHHDSDVRVNRGCGWVRHRLDCYKADNEDHLETVCQCFSDHCNGGALVTSSVFVTFATASVLGLRWLTT